MARSSGDEAAGGAGRAREAEGRGKEGEQRGRGKGREGARQGGEGRGGEGRGGWRASLSIHTSTVGHHRETDDDASIHSSSRSTPCSRCRMGHSGIRPARVSHPDWLSPARSADLRLGLYPAEAEAAADSATAYLHRLGAQPKHARTQLQSPPDRVAPLHLLQRRQRRLTRRSAPHVGIRRAVVGVGSGLVIGRAALCEPRLVLDEGLRRQTACRMAWRRCSRAQARAPARTGAKARRGPTTAAAT